MFAILIVAATSGGIAHAEFIPIRPPTCPNYTTIGWRYKVGAGTYEWEQPADWNRPTQYIDNVKHKRHFVGNVWTSRAGFEFRKFDLESGWDFLRFQPSGYSATSYTGQLSGWRDFPLPSHGIEISYETDFSIGRSGFYIDAARVCTERTTPISWYPWLVPQRRHQGLLLGKDDVVYFAAGLGTYKPGDDASRIHATIAMWSNTAFVDFDLYARCGALPTTTQYDARGYSSDAQEFIHLDPSICTPGQILYVAVHAYSNGGGYSGGGEFNIVLHRHYASEHRSLARAGISCTEPKTLVDEYADQMSRGFRRYFGATEGTQIWDRLEIWNNSGSPKMIYYRCADGRAKAGICSGHIDLFRNSYDEQTLAHELGHHISCHPDEYTGDSNKLHCGHSIMGSSHGTVTNFCYCDNWENSPPAEHRCAIGHGDHQRDPRPDDLNSLNVGPNWVRLKNRNPLPMMSETPDSYSYEYFDFNGLYDVQVMKY